MKKTILLFAIMFVFVVAVYAHAPYCDPTYEFFGTSYGGYLDDVELEDISNLGSGGDTQDDYQDYTAQSTNLALGTLYTLTVAPGGGQAYIRAWIDYNIDDDFDDTGEYLGGTIYLASGVSADIDFTVLAGASTGNTRMRIRASYFEDPVSPCADYSAGQAEDYTIVLEDVPVPVNLSAFYALYIGGTPSVYWTTETETDNSYWNVYRGISDNFEAAALLNANNPVPGNGTTNNASDYVYEDSVPVIQNTTYWYWIEDVSLDGESEVHEPVTLSIPSEDTPVTPDYGLHQNYPNPFNPSTSISFALQEESNVEVIIYNVKGEKIKSIFNDHINADQITVTVWDGNDAAGKQVSSGVYLYKLITDTKVYQKKMLLVK